MTDLYRTLGIPRTATASQVKAAYRKKAKRAHPDAGGSAELFKTLNLAYRVLFDPESRKRYDETGETEQDRSPDERGALYDMIAMIVLATLQDAVDPHHDNILALVAKKIGVDRKEFEQRIPKLEDLRRRLNIAVGRMETKEPLDWMNGALKTHLAKIDNQIMVSKAQIDFLDKAIRLVGEYSYRIDPRANVSSEGLKTFAIGGWVRG